ncbi:hypothetical protein [Paraburkholderia bryophila]|uniref:Putative nucleotidyltransferase n=1 Tax=Paraburkholderia bryophila TaxID=420952 RepID=A0A7Z0B380_9BURK|nr:hypothetical protein [Paraburkholderia bryophila]NYH19806.1 putative nucleotidyltransferase [Paraburkholderia bryophila]
MSNTLPLDLRDDRPLPAIVVELLRHVAATAHAAKLDWFVGGASARDIVLTHVHGIVATRATADVDIGVNVESWTGHGRATRRGSRHTRGVAARSGHAENRCVARPSRNG